MCVLLSSACLFRYNGLSLVYFLFVLTVPVLPNPSLVTMKGEKRKSEMCTVMEHLENTERISVIRICDAFVSIQSKLVLS